MAPALSGKSQSEMLGGELRMQKSSRFGGTGFRTGILVLVAVLVTGLAVWYFSGSLKGTVAVVNGRVITKDMMYEEMNKRVGLETLQTIIDNTVIMQEAAQRNLLLTDEEWKAEMDQVILEQYGSEESFLQLLQYYGITRQQIEEEWRTYFTARKLILADNPITDEDLLAHFEDNKDTFSQVETIQVRQMVLPSEQTAIGVLDEIEAGGDFSTIAEEKSMDVSTKANGGLIGWVEKGDLEEELEVVAFALKAGEISEPVESDAGFVLIQVTDREEAKEAVFEDVKDDVLATVEDTKINEVYSGWLEGLRGKAQIQIK